MGIPLALSVVMRYKATASDMPLARKKTTPEGGILCVHSDFQSHVFFSSV